MTPEAAISVLSSPGEVSEARLIALVLDSITSPHSRRSYGTGRERFLGWVRTSGTAPTFIKALAGQYRTHSGDTRYMACCLR